MQHSTMKPTVAKTTSSSCLAITRASKTKMSHSFALLGLAAAMCLIVGLVLMQGQSIGAMQLVEQVDQGRGQAGSGSSGGQQPTTATLAVVENPELVARVLENLLRSILYSTQADYQVGAMQSAQKRGLDLGISRGFSGSQAGKHLMGLSAASFANGPGRK